MSSIWWRLTRGLARIAVFCYYRSLRVENRERIPATGPVLFVLNHPNSLLDPAALLVASPRPVRFAAKGPLFRAPVLGFLLRRLGAVPIDRPSDEGSDVRRNVGALALLAGVLREGGACAIFPEGLSHLDPELKPVRSGPARVALEAEEAAGGALGLRVVPVGLAFHPRQVFRGDAVIRVGEPFRVDDLLGGNRHRAIRTVQGRISGALLPLIHHVDRVELAPMVEAVADLYGEQRRWTGREGKALAREEVVRAAGACLNYYLAADPGAVEEVGRRLREYGRLSGRAGIPEEAVRIRESPVRAFLAYAGLGLLLALGLPVFLHGLLTGFVPYRATDRAARALSARTGGAPALPFHRVVAGIPVFGAWWGILIALFHRWSGSPVVTGLFAASLPACGLLARVYGLRARSWAEGLQALLPFFARRRALARVAEVRAELLTLVEGLARRYEAALGQPLVAPAEMRVRRRFPWGRVSLVLLAGWIAWFAAGFRGTGMRELAAAPSPWRGLSPEAARGTVERDGRILESALETLAVLEERMRRLKAEFDSGGRDFYDPASNAEMGRALLTYLNCREGLFKIAWFYKDPDRPEPDLSARARLAGYAAAVELCARGMQFVDTFDPHPFAVRKLNEGDPVLEIPAGAYDRVRRNLADADVLDALAEAEARFLEARERGGLPAEGPWPRLAARASDGARVAAALAERLWSYKWASAVARARATGDRGRYAVSSVVSTWIGDARVVARPHDRGLVSPEQVESLRARLRPGDILVERRNWFLSNAFLPGYWKHAAVYLGGAEGVRSLGLEPEGPLAPHVAALALPDAGGRRREVLEAVSEGVIFTSLEESIGGADAVCAFRPRLPREALAEAVRRALLQHGKPYDFDFDFFSADRLVCTEVVFQAYEGALHFELVDVMGRRTLPAGELVRLWDRGRDGPRPPLAFVAFLDGDETRGIAREAGEAALRETLGRSGITVLQRDNAGLPLILSPAAAALLVMTLAGFLVFRRRHPPAVL